MERNERLKLAREQAGFGTATDAARAMGIPPPTYLAHENGTIGISAKKAPAYARKFGVTLDWLMDGIGPMRGHSFRFIVRGIVGAGGAVNTYDAAALADLNETVDLPDPETIGALLVKGDSQYPRFLDGEYVLYYTAPVRPSELVGQFAVVETRDGRSMLKRLRLGRKEGTFNLESLNADLEENVEVECAYRYLGTIHAGQKWLSKPLRVKKPTLLPA